MSTIPRVKSAIPDQPPHMVSALMHQPVLAKKLDNLYRLVWGEDFVSARIKEVARLRSARLVNCGACQNVRLDRPREEGLAEGAVDEINDEYMQSTQLSAEDKAAIMLTDAIVFDPTRMDQATKDAIREQFSEDQIVELAFEIAKLGAMAKMIITMGMEPSDQYYELVIPAPTQSFGLLGQEVLQGAE